jgi:hypothetical protein
MGPANPWSPSWRPDPTGNRATAIRSRIDAAVAGVALGLGAPIAAITSILISVAIFAAAFPKYGGVGEALGVTIRLGVLGALRFAPLVVVAVVLWIVVVRRLRERQAP